MKVDIRSAKWDNTQAIYVLLKQMGYPQPLALIQEKFELLNASNSQTFGTSILPKRRLYQSTKVFS